MQQFLKQQSKVRALSASLPHIISDEMSKKLSILPEEKFQVKNGLPKYSKTFTTLRKRNFSFNAVSSRCFIDEANGYGNKQVQNYALLQLQKQYKEWEERRKKKRKERDSAQPTPNNSLQLGGSGTEQDPRNFSPSQNLKYSAIKDFNQFSAQKNSETDNYDLAAPGTTRVHSAPNRFISSSINELDINENDSLPTTIAPKSPFSERLKTTNIQGQKSSIVVRVERLLHQKFLQREGISLIAKNILL